MAFTTGNDINILQASDLGTIGAGLGDDIYVLATDQMTAGQTINISDTQGANILRLVGGLTVASSKVAADTMQLTLSNGAVVNVLGASSFTFEIGGSGLSTSPVVQDFSTFVTSSLGLSEVPAGGEVVDGPADLDVNDDGSTSASGETGDIFEIAASADSVVEGNAVTFTVTNIAGVVAADTVVNYTITGVTADDLTGGALTGSVTILAGQSTATFSVTPLNEGVANENETMTVTLDADTNATASVSIQDPEAATFVLTQDATSVVEGNTVTFTITVAEGTAVTESTTLTYSVIGDTLDGVASAATAATDFFPASGTVTFAAGETSKTVTLTIADDGTTEGLEGLKFSLLNSDLSLISSKTVSISDGASAGQTFTLTTGTDNISGTTGNDTITGLRAATAAAATDTLTANDVINGGAGTDTLYVTSTAANTDATGGALISNVEVFNIRQTAATTNATTLDASKATGITAVNSYLGTGDVIVSNLASGASAGIVGDGTVLNGTLTFGYTSGVTAATLNIAGGTKGTNSAVIHEDTANYAATSMTVNSTGANNALKSLDLKGTGTASVTSMTINAEKAIDFGTGITNFTGTTASITISGAATNVAATSTAAENGAVDLGTIENTTVKTIDASGLTAGGIEVVLNTNTTIAVKGGAGNDDIKTGVVLTTGTVDAGAGTADILEIAAGGTHVADATLGGKYTNFEVLRLNDSQDVSFVTGITALELNAMTSETVSKITATQAGAITVKGTQTTALTLTLADATGAADVVSLALKNDTAATNVDVAGLSVIGVETLNVAATTGTAGTSSGLAFAVGGADKLTAINISGTADIGLVGTNTAKAVTVNSTTSGIATISGNFVNGSSITTGAGKDVITLGTGFGTYNSGAGDDAFTATVAQLNTGANYNTVNGGEGTDTLNINNGATNVVTIVDNNLSKVSGFEKIVIADSTTGNQSIQMGGWFDGAFKTNGVDLTTTTTTGTVTIDMTSFTGAAKITATTVGTAAADGVVSIQTGSGNDTVTVIDAAASNAGTISTYDGNDTIVGGVNDEVITGGKGMDVMTGGGTTANTFKFAAGDSGGAPSATVFDTIKDFTAVTGNIIDAGAASIVTNATATTGVAAISAAGVATFNAADTTLAQHIIAVEAAINAGGVAAAGQAAMWQEGADAFLFISDGVDGVGANDLLIKLVGLDTTAAAFDTLTDGGTTFTIA